MLRVKVINVLENEPENIRVLLAAAATLAALLRVRQEISKGKKSPRESIGRVIQELAIQGGVKVASTLIGKAVGQS